MRLIDADALAKECCVRRYEFESCEKCLEDYIGRGGEPICYLEYRGEDVRHAPTIDAIPVEWMRDKMRGYASALKSTELKALVTVMQMWEDEQGART